MSFLLRVVLPDRPGALGAVATALGTVDADIVSVDVVERGNGFAIDDLVVELPTSRLADSLITSACSVEGVRVESIRPYAVILDPLRELELIDSLVEHPEHALATLADGVARIFRAGWALIVAGAADHDAEVDVHARSNAAPELTRLDAPWWPVAKARTLDVSESWAPPTWAAVGTELAVAPLGERALLVGRPALRWLPAEVARLNHLAGIVATVL